MTIKTSLLNEQVRELQAKYKELRFFNRAGDQRIRGRILVEAEFDGKMMVCDYEIDIRIPIDYPVSIPQIFEHHGKIGEDFHKFENDELCLGAPHAVAAKFYQNRTLLGFVDEQVVPYLFSHACFVETGEMPFGELDHGDKGIYQYYCEKFNTDNAATIKEYLLSLLNLNSGKERSISCFCGSGRPLSECHPSDFYFYEEARSKGNLKKLIDGIFTTLDDVKKERRREFERSLVRILYFGSSIKKAIEKISRSRIPFHFFSDERGDSQIIDTWYEELSFTKKSLKTAEFADH